MTELTDTTKPKLYPNAGPFITPPLKPCCIDEYVFDSSVGQIMHHTSVLLTQESEGWFYVQCLQCLKKTNGHANPKGAVDEWNDGWYYNGVDISADPAGTRGSKSKLIERQ